MDTDSCETKIRAKKRKTTVKLINKHVDVEMTDNTVLVAETPAEY